MAAQVALPIRDEAFLLRSTSYGDDHRIVSFLTSMHGRVDAIALGAKKSQKRFSGVLDFVHRLEIEYQAPRRGGLPQLLRCELREDFAGVKVDYEAILVALGWMRLLSRVLQEGQSVAGLFALVEDGLHSLAAHRPAWVDAVFLRALLGRLGFFLELSRCLRCRNDRAAAYFFDPAAGGLVCERCHHGDVSRPLGASIPESYWSTEGEGLQVEFAADSRRIFREGFRYYLGVESAGADFG